MVESKYEPITTEYANLLPRDVFKNCFTYYCNELINYPIFKYWAVIFTILLAITGIYLSHNPFDGFSLTLVVVTFSTLVFICIPLILYSQPELNLDCKLKFCNEVIANKPNLDMETWSVVCRDMNDFMYLNKYWSTPFYFYDTKTCFNCFKVIVIKRYLNIPKSLANDQINEFPTVGGSNSNNTPRDMAEDFENYDIDRYMKRARDVYNESVDDYLKNKYPEYEV